MNELSMNKQSINELSEKIPDPKELEKELGDFLTKKFGGSVKLAAPIIMPQPANSEADQPPPKTRKTIQFDLKPQDLVTYLDQYIVKQTAAKDILATKICTHFNRIKHVQSAPDDFNDMVGVIKNNVLMLGPTGVGKTYMVRLIAKKIGVPFVKGDATKFSETGYVGGDVEDLVRDLVREADGDIELAQYGIVYIDEIDKIASSQNLMGADVSRTGVQRALLKPMEETEVDLKVPHDPVSMLQEIDRFRKTGKKEKNSVNTKHILFIMSGAFSGLEKIISRRVTEQKIGFGATIANSAQEKDMLARVKSEDLVQFGFESEFVGRLPVRAVFERLTETDLCDILKNPNNPIVLGKKLDFAAYGIDVKFHTEALEELARRAYAENTGARGLVSAVEGALLPFEKALPSSTIKRFAVTREVIDLPLPHLADLLDSPHDPANTQTFDRLAIDECLRIEAYVADNRKPFGEKYGIQLTDSRIALVAEAYCRKVTDIEKVLKKVKSFYEETKTIELYFIKNHGINIVLEEEAIDAIIERCFQSQTTPESYYPKLTADFEHGLKLVREKTGRTRFFITREALEKPEHYIADLLKKSDDLPRLPLNPDNLLEG
ncbi:ATPase AAA-2 domain protein [Desulfosarcina cetonica]|uniref:AAA family ATPase n=1 Tax=Desulfosarcina cetonica TaxID=90730 RepID=UPI000AF98290|nr:AAA family ATPase [Desulfosarcina cetonica]VTR65519.1 ATPase AAA-2 domain protein [Desulfosarcina cetonica]